MSFNNASASPASGAIQDVHVDHSQNDGAFHDPNSPAHTEIDMIIDSAMTAAGISPSARAEKAIRTLNARAASLAEQLALGATSEERQAIHQEFEAITRDLQLLNSASHLVSANARTSPSTQVRVPADLPALQWADNIHAPNKTVFGSVDECLDSFEDVVASWQYDANDVWPLFVPRMLSPEQRYWFGANLKPYPYLPWSKVRAIIISRYGVQDTERKVQKLRELLRMRMNRNESVELFTDRFNRVRREAGLANDLTTTTIFIEALLPELAKHVMIGQVNVPVEMRSTIEQAAAMARSLYSSVVLSMHSKELTNEQPTQTTRAPSPGSVAAPRNKTKATTKFCRLHGKGRHSTSDCRQLAAGAVPRSQGNRVSKPSTSSSVASAASVAASTITKSESDKNCFRCGEPGWTRSHKCRVNHLAIPSATLAMSAPASAPASVSRVPATASGSVVAVPVGAVPAAVPVGLAPAAVPMETDISMADVSASLNQACAD